MDPRVARIVRRQRSCKGIATRGFRFLVNVHGNGLVGFRTKDRMHISVCSTSRLPDVVAISVDGVGNSLSETCPVARKGR
jgi:hypothetical protein